MILFLQRAASSLVRGTFQGKEERDKYKRVLQSKDSYRTCFGVIIWETHD